LRYFSECILNNESPELNAEEGFADVRVLGGLYSIKKSTG
jgi:hypothetical protein